MINKVILMGRITHDLETKQTPAGSAVLSFSLAVERSYAKQGEERQTDFITCVAWGKTAEFIGRYFAKGRMIAVVGDLRSRTYEDKNGTKHYVTEVYISEASFTGEKTDTTQNAQNGTQSGSKPYAANYPQNGGQVNQSAQEQPDLSDFDLFSEDGVPF